LFKKVLGFTYREYNSLRVFGFNANSITPFFVFTFYQSGWQDMIITI